MEKTRAFIGATILAAVFWPCGARLEAQQPPVRVDRVIIESKASEILLLKDVAEGKIDLLARPVDAAIIDALPASDRDRLLLAYVPWISWSILLNPAADPSAAPGIVRGSDGTERFNPFGIPAVRRALASLIDRRKIVGEICRSRGVAMYTPVRLDAPSGLEWNRAVFDLGMTEGGNPEAAADLRKAMEEAAKGPGMRGRLAFGEGSWRFDGEKVKIRFLIRSDDPTGRLLVGRYLAGLIETTGISVERLEYAKTRCLDIVNKSDPANLEWSAYTEAWGSGGASAWQDELFLQMYCPSYGNMPGAGHGERWKYANEELDRVGEELFYGRFPDRASYEKSVREGMRAALGEAVRVYIAGMDMAIVASKSRLGTMPCYDLTGGFGPWAIRSAIPPPGPDGKRVLRIGVKIAGDPSIFSSAWDPLGPVGFGNALQVTLFQSAVDRVEEADPVTGMVMANRDRLVESSVSAAGLQVPASALVWDGPGGAWKKAGPGLTATARLVFEYDAGPWQDGRPFTSAEAVYELASLLDWSRKDGDGDLAWDPDIESSSGPWVAPFVAIEPLGPRRLAVYGKASWLWDTDRLRASLAVGGGIVPWPIDEALQSLVKRGGKSGASYRFTPWEEGCREVDLAAPLPFADLLAELERLDRDGKVPTYLLGIVGPEEASAARKAALDFMRKRGHALDSNGPFEVDRLNPESGSIELTAFGGYPFTPGRVRESFARQRARIDRMELPALIRAAAGFQASCTVSALAYPGGQATPAGDGPVASLRLVGGGRELSVAFKPSGKGQFQATVPASALAGFPPGAYTLLVEVRIGDTLPDLDFRRVLLSP